MHTITTHLANPTDTGLDIHAIDDPDPNAGGACHVYDITAGEQPALLHRVAFQHGPVKEHGRNGVTEASLLAVLIDRYEHFQAGPFASPYNADTLAHLRAALDAQHRRTRDREERGVEGRNAR